MFAMIKITLSCNWIKLYVLYCSLSTSCLCCPTMCLSVLSVVLWGPLRFPRGRDVRFVFVSSGLCEGSCLVFIVCVCLRVVVSNTYCVAFFFVLCTVCWQFLWIFHLLFAPSVFSEVFLLVKCNLFTTSTQLLQIQTERGKYNPFLFLV